MMQSRPAVRSAVREGPMAGGARLAPFLGKRGWQLGILGALFFLMLTTGHLTMMFVRIQQEGVGAAVVDFRVFWAAAHLAGLGEPMAPFDLDRLNALTPGSDALALPWLYPPGLLSVITPLGALSFWSAFATITGLSVFALVTALRPFAREVPPVWLAVAFAPACLPAILMGQISLLWMAGLLAAMAALRADRPLLAGVLIGCLTLKPQLGLLIPLALIAAGNWRTILGASVTALCLAAGPTLFYGLAYWPALAGAMEAQFAQMQGEIASLGLMVSPYSAFAGLGAPEPVALVLQWLVTVLSGGVVWVAWRDPQTSFDLRAAVLLAAIPLSSPYLWYYDTALLPAAALFMFRAGVLTTRGGHLLLGAAMWLGAAPSTLLTIAGNGGAVSARYPVSFVMMIAMMICARAILRRRQAA